MLSEEEKKAIDGLKQLKKDFELVDKIVKDRDKQETKTIDAILNLIEKQQTELNTLKEIEKSHKEENGKLRVELEQYKLLEANIDKANKIIAENKFDEGLYGLLMQEKEKNKDLQKQLNGAFDRGFISKDKIKEIYNILGEYRHFSTPTNEQIEQNENAVDKAVNFIKELLEEK